MKRSVHLFLLLIFAVSVLGAHERIVEPDHYFALAKTSNIFAAEAGVHSDTEYGPAFCMGISGRYDTDIKDWGAFVHVQFGTPSFNKRFHSLGFHFRLGPQVGKLPGYGLAVGVRTDLGYTLASGLTVGLASEKNWAKGSQSFRSFGYVGWRF